MTAEQVQQQISKAKQDISIAESEIKQQKERARRTEEFLRVKEKKLPSITQKSLRQGQFEGLNGRQRRRELSKEKKSIKETLTGLGLAKKSIEKFETERLIPYKQQVLQTESQLREYRINQEAVDVAERVASGKAPLLALDSSLKKKYYNMIKSSQETQIQKTLNDIQKQAGGTLSGAVLGDLYKQLKQSGQAVYTIEKPLAPETLDGVTSQVMINPKTGLTVGTNILTTTPTFGERFKERIGKEGYVSGILSTIPQETAKYFSELQRKQAAEGKGELYQLGATSRAISELPKQALYFSPIGGAVIFGESAEALGTKAGRERLSETSQSLQAQGLSPITSKVLTYGGTGAGLVLGGLGLRGQIKNLQTIRELKLLEKTPTISTGVRLEQGSKGVDILRGVKDVKGTKYITEIRQPYYRVGRDRVILESGEGTALRLGKKGDVQVSIFETFGRGQSVKTTPKKLMAIGEKYSVGKEIKGFEPSLLRLGTREVFTGTGKIKRGKVKLKTGEIEGVSYKNILGLSKEEAKGELIVSTSGEITGFKYDPFSKTKSVLAKPDEASILIKKKIPVAEDTGVLSFQGKGKTSSQEYFQKLYSSDTFSSSLLGEGISKVKPVVKETKTFGATGIIKEIPAKTQPAITQPSLFAGTGLYERTESFSAPLSLRTDIKQDIGIRTDLKTNLLTQQDIRTKLKTDLLSRTKTDTKIKTDTGIKAKQPIKSLLDIGIKQKVKTTLKTKTTTITKPTPILKTPLKPKLEIKGKIKKKIELGKEEDEFEIFGRRFGKDVKIGEASSKFETERIFRKFAKGGLGRSGQIFKGGKALSFKEFNLGGEFRESVKDPYRLVQKSKFALGTKQEVFAIQRARKKKKKRGFF